MKLLFFSVTKHQYHYFEMLKKHLPFHIKHIFFPSLRVSKKGWRLHQTLDLDEIITMKQKEISKKYANPVHRWIYKFILRLQIPWLVSIVYKALSSYKPDYIILWNGKKFHQAIAHKVAESLKIKAVFFENGVLPHTTTMDFHGVNASNSVPREKAFYRQLHYEINRPLPDSLQARVSKKKRKSFHASLPKRYIFVPFQVAYDTQIIQHSPWIEDMFELFEIIEWLAQKTDLVFVIKEHPSDRVSEYKKLYEKANEHIIFSSRNTQELIENASAIMTINSSVAIESLLFQKRVIVLGEAFFAIEGIVKVASSKEQIKAILTTLEHWEIDTVLVENFLKYLYYDYLIADSWREPTQKHYDMVQKRLETGC